MADLASVRWWSRAVGAVRGWVRSALGRVVALRSPPPRPGITTGRVARAEKAESDLRAMSQSPTVFAALNRRALSLTMYPIRVYSGFSIGGRRAELLDPEAVPWVGSLLRLLQTPSPADGEALFPAVPGEQLFAQVIADLLTTGNAFVAVVLGAGEAVVGLARLHPQSVSLERVGGEEFWVVRVYGAAGTRSYPRRTVAHLRLLSWQMSAAGDLGTGAGEALRELVRAETTALSQTADVVEQGGADVMVTGKSAAASSWLSSDRNRQQLTEQLTKSLSDSGRRVFAVGGDFEVKDVGLKPADLRAPETLKESRAAEMMAIGVVPVALGADAGTYATAVQQYRVQAEMDEALVGVLEAGLFRPLARHFARRAGGRWARRGDQVTARFDLASHPGYAYVRTDAITRMRTLVELGWSATQAAEIEGLDLPGPEGPPRLAALPPDAAVTGAPRRPLGDTGSAPALPAEEPMPRKVIDLFRRRTPDEARVALWRAAEAQREAADAGLLAASQAVLDEESRTYAEVVEAGLEAARRTHRSRAAGDGGTQIVEYAPIDLDELLGGLDDAIARWTSGLTPEWLASWEGAADRALAETEVADEVPLPEPKRADLRWIEESAEAAADYSRARVRSVVEAGLDQGDSPSAIAEALRQDQGFSRERALRIARTETVRSESAGTQARYAEAEAKGIRVAQEWLSDAYAAQFDRRHDRMDGKRVDVGEHFVLPSGVRTLGPGLSGDVSEDVNCRCALRPVVSRA